MENSKQRTEELIDLYLSGKATPEERNELERLYAAASQKTAHIDDLEIDQINQLKKEGLIQAITEIRTRNAKFISIWPRIAVAAATVAAVVLCVYFFSGKHEVLKWVRDEVVVNDIAPGKNGATITLANGEVIELSDAKSGVVIGDRVSYSDGSVVRYSSGTSSSGSPKGSQNSSGPVGVRSLSLSDLQGANSKGQMLTASTAKGQTYQFTLPDGTCVWLNADSKLEFPSDFMNSKTRNVKLVGEGYFEVAKDKARPFIVKSAGQEVEVLGTHFNISAYPDESVVKTTLLEGKVRVNIVAANSNKFTRTLSPGQQSVLSGNGGIKMENVNASDATAWKDGKFRFNKTNLNEVMARLSTWYDVDVQYQDNVVPSGMSFTGGIDRRVKLSVALDILRDLGVKFKVEGKTIFVYK